MVPRRHSQGSVEGFVTNSFASLKSKFTHNRSSSSASNVAIMEEAMADLDSLRQTYGHLAHFPSDDLKRVRKDAETLLSTIRPLVYYNNQRRSSAPNALEERRQNRFLRWFRRGSTLKKSDPLEHKVDSNKSAIFGMSLSEILAKDSMEYGPEKIPVPRLVALCLEALQNHSGEENLFQLTMSTHLMQRARTFYETDPQVFNFAEMNPHEIASFMKEFLKEIPDLSLSNAEVFAKVQRLSSEPKQMAALQLLYLSLRPEQRNLFEVLIRFLEKVARENKSMNSEKLAEIFLCIFFGDNLRPNQLVHLKLVLHLLISHATLICSTKLLPENLRVWTVPDKPKIVVSTETVDSDPKSSDSEGLTSNNRKRVHFATTVSTKTVSSANSPVSNRPLTPIKPMAQFALSTGIYDDDLETLKYPELVHRLVHLLSRSRSLELDVLNDLFNDALHMLSLGYECTLSHKVSVWYSLGDAEQKANKLMDGLLTEILAADDDQNSDDTAVTWEIAADTADELLSSLLDQVPLDQTNNQSCSFTWNVAERKAGEITERLFMLVA